MSSEKITARMRITRGKWMEIREIIGQLPDVHEVILIVERPPRQEAEQRRETPKPRSGSGNMKGF